jgi:putative ABC transport system substrate-binding protein
MRRREFLGALAGSVVTWPLAVRAQQPRQIGMLLIGQESDAATRGWIAVFQGRLRTLGWVEDRTIRFERRYAGGDPQRISANIVEIVGLRPDVILAQNTPMVAALRRQTDSIPIVFVQVSDPIGDGFVESLAHPGGNATGFTNTSVSDHRRVVEVVEVVVVHVNQLRSPCQHLVAKVLLHRRSKILRAVDATFV